MFNAYFFIVLLVIPIISYIVLCVLSRNSKSKSNETGFDIARKILDDNGLNNYIVLTKGLLVDHYDYSQRVVRLSSVVYDGTSVFAHVIASYIAMIAVMDKEKNSHIKVRGYLVNVVKFLMIAAMITFILGLIMSYQFIEFALCMMIVIYLYCIYSIYGTMQIIKRIKDKDSLWILYLFDFSAIVVSVISGVNDLIERR